MQQQQQWQQLRKKRSFNQQQFPTGDGREIRGGSNIYGIRRGGGASSSHDENNDTGPIGKFFSDTRSDLANRMLRSFHQSNSHLSSMPQESLHQTYPHPIMLQVMFIKA